MMKEWERERGREKERERESKRERDGERFVRVNTVKRQKAKAVIFVVGILPNTILYYILYDI